MGQSGDGLVKLHTKTGHTCSGERVTATGFLACDDCGSPIVVDLADLRVACPGCAWDAFVFARTFRVVWCWRCGHEWDVIQQTAMKGAH